MLKELNIPRMGSVENAKLVGWRIAEGQTYNAGDILYEIETDKTTTEVEAVDAGIFAKATAAVGDEFKVGDTVGWWALPGTSTMALRAAVDGLDGDGEIAVVADALPVVATETLPWSAAVRPVSIAAAGGQRISPLARRLAAQHGVNVARVTGSGANGKITGKDVLAAASTVPDAIAPVSAPALPLIAEAAPPASATVEGARVVPHSTRRRTIARRMVEAAAIPSLTADMEVDLTALMAFRARPEGKGASVLGVIAYAAVLALLENPQLNAHWRDDALVLWDGVHLGVAVDTPDGLVVPVIRHAERLNARGMTEAIAALAAKAREGRLQVADMEGGSFTLSNPGSLGPVRRAEALLNPPQVALLGLPGIERVVKPVPDGAGWSMAVRQVLRPSLTFDHRAFDGGPAIAYLNTLKSRIESL